MSEQSVDRSPAAVLDERYGRREPLGGFVWRAAVGGMVGGLLGTVVYGALTSSSWGAGVWLVLLYGFVFVCMIGSVVGVVASVAGLGAERAGRTVRSRTALLAATGGLAVAVQLELLALLAGTSTAGYPPMIGVAVGAGALGGALLVRLRHRTLRQALPGRRRTAPAR